jgi:glyoxylase-like metal-dependent hydrolase (beta-lactamase superfamily II)
VPGVDRIVLTHGHVDHTGSAAELRESTGAPVQAVPGDAAVIRGEAEMAPSVLQDTERPIVERVPVTASGRWPTSRHTDAVAAEPGVEPDTLDWTWVLTRRCPECGLDPAVVHHACDMGHRVRHAYNVGHR